MNGLLLITLYYASSYDAIMLCDKVTNVYSKYIINSLRHHKEFEVKSNCLVYVALDVCIQCSTRHE